MLVPVLANRLARLFRRSTTSAMRTPWLGCARLMVTARFEKLRQGAHAASVPDSLVPWRPAEMDEVGRGVGVGRWMAMHGKVGLAVHADQEVRR